MARRQIWLTALLVFASSAMLTACGLGAAQAPPVDPVGTADLKPVQKDTSAGMVTVRPGFDLRKYSSIAVTQFAVTDSGVMNKDEVKMLVTIPFYFQTKLVGKLRETNMFKSVEPVKEGGAPPTDAGTLRLEGRITRLAAGDDTSMWVPFSGYSRLGDRTKAQIETALVDAQTGQVMVVTADRREAPNPGNQSANDYVQDTFEALARDLVNFIERLGKGEAARTN
jgi:curli biogenesis system outer membrane secretion channel CsgG